MKYLIDICIVIIFILCIYYLYFTNTRLQLGPQKIPKIIIQTWKTKDIPPKYQNYVDSIKKHNPDYEYLFFDDKDIHNFLKNYYPIYYETFKKLPLVIQKIDFFRYIAVYHYGGFYLDLDMKCFENFDDLLSYSSVFPVDDFIIGWKTHDDRYKTFILQNQSILLGQYAFGSEPKNKFLKKIIDGIHSNINSYIKHINANDDIYVYQTTGPDYITEKYIEYTNKHNIHILSDCKRQCFGKYAKHLYMGSWKIKN